MTDTERHLERIEEKIDKIYDEARKTNGRVIVLEGVSNGYSEEFKRVWKILKFSGTILAIMILYLVGKGILPHDLFTKLLGG